MHKDPENDPVWDLLGNASQQEAGPMFSRDVMRSIRLEQQQAPAWWQRILRPAPVVGTLATAAACVALVFFATTEQPSEVKPVVAQSDFDESSLGEIAAIFDANDELDDLISPISLLASNDLVLEDYEAFMSY